MPNCKARYTTYDHRLYFADGKHRFFMELCCGQAFEGEGEMCVRCSQKKPTPLHYNKSYDHGVIDGPYLKGSQLYDTPYYHWAVAKFGEPKPSDVEKAMEAQRRAKAAVSGGPVPTQETPKPKKPKEKTEKPKKEPSEKPAKQPRAKSKKVAETVVSPEPETKATAVTQIPAMVTFAESTDEPMQVSEVVQILLKRFQHKGKTYWRDSEREKLYTCTAAGKRGGYVGRWDSTAQTIDTDAPDSDLDA